MEYNKKNKLNTFGLIFTILITLILTIILIIKMIDYYNRERCYNMPINKFVEDEKCTKYTWEDYREVINNE